MDKVHKTHFTVPEMPWKEEEGMDKYKLYYYELARYINALAKDCYDVSSFLHVHGYTDPWAKSRELFDKLSPEVRDTLQRLREESE